MIQDEIACVILSGGKSSRMGQDKSMMKISNNITMIEYLYNKMKRVFHNIYISSKYTNYSFIESKHIILDNNSIASPMVAFDTIFNTLDYKYLFIISVDTPLVNVESVKKLYDTIKNNNYDIVIAKDSLDNIHNLCGIFNTNIKTKVAYQIQQDNHKINSLIKSVPHHYLEFNNWKQFTNINRYEDFLEAQKYIDAGQE
jgi:molybdopterin-guanine dinucleotide biosynthesis protein A